MKLKFEYQFVIIYIILGGLWILSTDWILLSIIDDINVLSEIQTYKGWFYVTISALIFFLIIRSHLLKVRKAEQTVRESERLKTAFLQNISHEVRTPLNGIMGFSSLFSEDSSLSHEKVVLYSSIIYKNSLQLLSTINNVLDISLMESGQIKPNDEVFDLNTLMLDIKAKHSGDLNKETRFVLETPKNLSSLTIESDRNLIKQVLDNLVNNAIKFTHDGQVTFGYEKGESEIVFYVKDTGIGISTKYHKAIFENFSQADYGNSTLYGGTGLGLAICKSLVKILKGELRMQSEECKGSEFFVKIPCKITEYNIAKNEQTLVIPTNTTVLIVEDDQSNQDYLGELFKSQTVNTLYAGNGKEAIQLCAENPAISIVLMDLKMPVMDGIQATREIRQNFPEMPIIVQTAFALNRDKERAMKAGASGFIAKPYTKEDLFALMVKHL
jgi:signal transduction histidine kinase